MFNMADTHHLTTLTAEGGTGSHRPSVSLQMLGDVGSAIPPAVIKIRM